MIHVRSSSCRALLRVRLIDRIDARDFNDIVMPAFECLLARYGQVEMLVLDVRYFEGWGDAATFEAQVRFLKTCGRETVRVAVLGCRAWRGAVPAIAALFVAAEVRAFTPEQGTRLRDWIRASAPNCPRQATLFA